MPLPKFFYLPQTKKLGFPNNQIPPTFPPTYFTFGRYRFDCRIGSGVHSEKRCIAVRLRGPTRTAQATTFNEMPHAIAVSPVFTKQNHHRVLCFQRVKPVLKRPKVAGSVRFRKRDGRASRNIFESGFFRMRAIAGHAPGLAMAGLIGPIPNLSFTDLRSGAQRASPCLPLMYVANAQKRIKNTICRVAADLYKRCF